MGGRSGGPSGQTQTGTQDGDLQSRTDRQTGTMAELGAQVAMAELEAQEAMAELGAQEAMVGGPRGPWPRSPRPLQLELYYPPQKKNSLGK